MYCLISNEMTMGEYFHYVLGRDATQLTGEAKRTYRRDVLPRLIEVVKAWNRGGGDARVILNDRVRGIQLVANANFGDAIYAPPELSSALTVGWQHSKSRIDPKQEVAERMIDVLKASRAVYLCLYDIEGDRNCPFA
ncbi:Aste57867_13361 [Aphanomyces stellatus]|uniref:Aste57867_13361 protein n=1 Tax=Aphanomyces stellatus TaxID=120398 RepID=A0A485KYT2_9STRA|nr:hypothetical protein As57867_013311 [Aphanomyces stellatus]VFT90200.1 Aste57867_13361 [Aphanomyces stellatus]